jgi:GT2 family glycosyltransferase
MKIVDVIIPTLGKMSPKSHPFICFENLHHIPWPSYMHVVTGGKTWAQAINIGLEQTSGNDVILMDDDVFINPETFKLVNEYYNDADIFGFKLFFPDGKIQHAGGIVRNQGIGHIGWRSEDGPEYNDPKYVCHVTTSLIYIKRHVIDKLKGMTVMPGQQMEDVDFNFRAIKEGFKILYLPSPAIHMESATKRFFHNFQQDISRAYTYVVDTHFKDAEFVKKLTEYPKPFVKELIS